MCEYTFTKPSCKATAHRNEVALSAKTGDGIKSSHCVCFPDVNDMSFVPAASSASAPYAGSDAITYDSSTSSAFSTSNASSVPSTSDVIYVNKGGMGSITLAYLLS